MKLFNFLLLLVALFKLEAQQINMNFSGFNGKSYDFIIFQGSEQKIVSQGVIPEDGNFSLIIPKEYFPYKGMSRWLITGTKEGGGLNMYIPGDNFSVSCSSEEPNDTNILFKDNYVNAELNELYKQQKKIIDRYQVMLQAVNIFTINDHNYQIFKNEFENQKKDYDKFQSLLDKKADYIYEFVRIVNITNGIGTKLYDNDIEKADNISFYIAHNLDWNILYTSGHWWSIISAWVSIHTKILKDKSRFMREFELVSSKLKNDKFYMDFISRVNYFLKVENRDDYIEEIELMLGIQKNK